MGGRERGRGRDGMFHKGENTRPVILLFVISCWNCISDLESCKVTLHTRPPPPSIQAYSLLVIKNKITCRKSVENDALLFWPLSPLSLPHPSPSFYPIHPLWLAWQQNRQFRATPPTPTPASSNRAHSVAYSFQHFPARMATKSGLWGQNLALCKKYIFDIILSKLD